MAAYVDDTTSERDFEVVGRILEEFCQVSGARGNVGKSSVMFFGLWAEKARGGFSICVDGLKILGVRFFFFFLGKTVLRKTGGEDSKVEL